MDDRKRELISLLKKGAISKFNKIRKYEKYRRISLEGVNLQGATLNKIVGIGLVLSRANLESADLTGANLKGVILSDANMRNARLIDAILDEANMKGTILIAADLEGASLQLVDLDGADLSGANLRGANMRLASLEKANLVSANLVNANLESATLNYAILYGSFLSKANFKHAFLNNADLRGADLTDTILEGAHQLQDAKLGELSIDDILLSSDDDLSLKNRNNDPDMIKFQNNGFDVDTKKMESDVTYNFVQNNIEYVISKNKKNELIIGGL